MIQTRVLNQGKGQAGNPDMDHAAVSIGVVIVSYNSRELLRDCLASIESERWEQVIVVDNVSSDGSDTMVMQDFPWVRLIVNQKNDGYGAAANLAIASCSCEYVLLLNSDTTVQPETVQVLSGYLDQHPRVGIAGPQLMNPDGTSQVSSFEFPTPLQLLLRDTSLSRFVRHDPRSSNEVPWVLGAALAIRRSAFDEVHGFDESFFMYFEEVDLCYRFNKAGWQIHFVPEAHVTHLGGGSTRQYHAAMAIQLYKSLCHFYLRHYSALQRFQLRCVITYLMLRNIARDSFRSFRARKQIANHYRDDLKVWRSVLYNIWSTGGWLKDRSVSGDAS